MGWVLRLKGLAVGWVKFQGIWGAEVSAMDGGMDGNKVEKSQSGSGYTTSNDKESMGKDGQIPDVKRYDADGTNGIAKIDGAHF